MQALKEEHGALTWELVMGGLAPDSSEPMPAETRAYVQRAWDAVEQTCGVRFNRDFWERCEPRRSTYPACRAVIAAEKQCSGAGWEMYAALQRAYYRQARNPSLVEVLVEVASELPGLNPSTFGKDLASRGVQSELEAHLARRLDLGVHSFPTLLLERQGHRSTLARGYAPLAEVRRRLVLELG